VAKAGASQLGRCDRHRRWRRNPDIALAILRGDIFGRLGAIAELGPQPVDQKVDVAIGRVGFRRGDLIKQTAAPHQPMRVAREGEQQSALVAGELDGLAVAAREQAGFVEDQISEGEILRFAHSKLRRRLPTVQPTNTA
jgi:hypothetical protein